jgi:hypothetical protein
MNANRSSLFLAVLALLRAGTVSAQQPAPSGARAQAEPEAVRVVAQDPGGIGRGSNVPRLIKWSGALKTVAGTPLTGTHGLTLALYKDQQDGAPIWLESQNVELDEQGRYTVLLGSAKTEGLPLDLFRGDEPRWLGVQVQLPGYREEARVLLVSVPFALKAVDAETLGGKPLSAFVQTEQLNRDLLNSAGGSSVPVTASVRGALGVTGGTPGTLALFASDGASLINSAVVQSGGNIGIETATPTAGTLQVTSTLDGPPPLYWSANSNAYPTAANTSGAIGGNFSANNGEVNFWNAQTSATTAFDFSQLTGTTSRNVLLTLLSNGQVGIGTAYPTAAQLQIATAYEGPPALYWSSNSSVYPAASLTSGAIGGNFTGGNGEVNFWNVQTSASTAFDFSQLTGATSRKVLMSLESSGNVGIGTPTPTQKLEVDGNLLIGPANSGSGIIFPDGTTQTSACGALGFSTSPQSATLRVKPHEIRLVNNGQSCSYVIEPPTFHTLMDMISQHEQSVKDLQTDNTAMKQTIQELRAELQAQVAELRRLVGASVAAKDK